MNTDVQKITLHRALAEVKLIDSKINKKIKGLEAVVLSNPKTTKERKDEFEKSLRADTDSIEALINRSHKLRTEINKANALTTFQVAGETYTIAEAIIMRRNLDANQNFINTLAAQYSHAKEGEDRNNVDVESTGVKLGEALARGEGNSSTRSKMSEEVQATIDAYVAANRWTVFDPLNIPNFVKERQDKIDSFLMEVDAALSVVNATTVIEV